MNTKQLFLSVSRECEMDGAAFLQYASDCIRRLSLRYPLSHLVAREGYTLPALHSMSDACPLHDDYESAMIWGIVACKTGDPKHMARFEEDADGAYRKRWRALAAGRRALPGGDRR